MDTGAFLYCPRFKYFFVLCSSEKWKRKGAYCQVASALWESKEQVLVFFVHVGIDECKTCSLSLYLCVTVLSLSFLSLLDSIPADAGGSIS